MSGEEKGVEGREGEDMEKGKRKWGKEREGGRESEKGFVCV